MFYINEKKIKEYTAVDYLKTEKFQKIIKPKILKLFNPEFHRKYPTLQLFETKKSLSESLESKLSKDEIKSIKGICSYIGKWSEFFIENLISYPRKKLNFNLEQMKISSDFEWEIIKNTTESTRKYFQTKSRKGPQPLWFLEINPDLKYKYSFFLHIDDFSKHKNRSTLTVLMAHFQSLAPHCSKYTNWAKFTNLNTYHRNTEYKNECEITGWEFDFFDLSSSEIVELKFQNKWDVNWIWQLLIYTYLMDFYFKIRPKGIKILNTFTGEEWSISLHQLFPGKRKERFYRLLKEEISDYEKIRFMNRVLSSFKDWENSPHLEEIIQNNFFLNHKDPKIMKYSLFIQELNTHRSELSFFSNIHSEKWIWREWTSFLYKNPEIT